MMSINLDGKSVEEKRREIRRYFNNSSRTFEKLFECFRDEDVFYEQPESTRHPLMFYFGHTAAFFINKLMVANVIDKRINAEYENTFAVGVDEMRWDDLEKIHYKWPSVDEAKAYRAKVRKLVEELIETLPLTLPIKQEDPMWIILMGIEHERIHIETSSVLHRQLPLEMAKPHKDFPVFSGDISAHRNSMVSIEGKIISLGKDENHHLYGWDNEYGVKTVDVKDFQTSKYLISNGDFLRFVQAGGYKDTRFWDEEGLDFLKEEKVEHPPFWVKQRNGSFKIREMLEEMPFNPALPVEVNYLEAKAYTKFLSLKEKKHIRLPSEAEWMLLYERAGLEDVPAFNVKKANINLEKYASSCPVDTFDFDDIYDVVGNVWQWTESHMEGYDGFKYHPAYDDFSIPCFDAKHNLIKGGSWASTGNEITKYARYAFRRHFYQHAGFRTVIGDDLKDNNDNIYETDTLVSQYCEFQYGDTHFGVENFAAACAQKAIMYMGEHKMSSALDLGCATGRTSFELARHFDKVTGIDFSARFVQVGAEMQRDGVIHYMRQEEGALSSKQERTLSALGLEDTASKVDFWQGDACNLKEHFSGYDLLLATNLIDRLYNPMLFLDDVAERLNEGGLLILTSPYTWLEEYTKKELWLGGYMEDGVEVSTLDGLKFALAESFELVATEDVPFVISETPRKFQHTLAQMSVWRKK